MQIQPPGMTGKGSWNYFHQSTFPTIFVAESQEPTDVRELHGDLQAFRKTSVSDLGLLCEVSAGNISTRDFLDLLQVENFGPEHPRISLVVLAGLFYSFLCSFCVPLDERMKGVFRKIGFEMIL